MSKNTNWVSQFYNNIKFASLFSLSILIINIPNLIASYNEMGFCFLLKLIALLISFNMVLSSILLLIFGRVISQYLSASIIIISSISSYYKYYYGIIVGQFLIESVLSTNLEEVLELINLSIILWVLGFGLLQSIIFIKVTNKYTVFFRIKLCSFLVFVALFCSIFTIISLTTNNLIYPVKYWGNSIITFPPINYLYSTFQLIKVKMQSREENIEKIDQFKNHKIPKFTLLDNLKVILVIGESLRADHLSLNGYKRSTTPELEKIENLISFTDAYSLGTDTIEGIKHILLENPDKNEYSIIQFFNYLGFNSYWIANQYMYARVASIIPESKYMVPANIVRQNNPDHDYDEALLPFVRDIVKEKNNDFIILHTRGSHRLYDLRYPIEFKHYMPVCTGDIKLYQTRYECNDINKITNSYDNSILYTDYVLSSLIRDLEDQYAILIYISDHGESLGENNVFSHAAPIEEAPKEQIHVGMFVWLSDKLLENGLIKEKFNNIKLNQHKTINQKFIAHSLVDCIGVETIKFFNPLLSICRKIE